MRSLRRRVGGGEVGAMELFLDDCIFFFLLLFCKSDPDGWCFDRFGIVLAF